MLDNFIRTIKTNSFHFKRRLLILIAVFGPAIITSFADNDAGGVATYSVAASKFGYHILTFLIPITIILAITQELGVRIAIVTGKGLGDLIRERFGIKISMLIFSLLFLVNFGVILQDVRGLKEALNLFGLDYRIFLPLVIMLIYLLVIKTNYKKIERIFLVLLVFYFSYLFSAILSKPDWNLTLRSLIIPKGKINFGYLYTSIAVLGTTVTAWGQFFINSYVKDKKITVTRLKYSQFETYVGSILTNVFSLFMMVAVAATIFKHNIIITGASEAALAIKPLAGEMAGTLFGVGLLIAGILGTIIVPLATAYAFSEFFGYSGSLDEDFKRSKLFYIFFLVQIILGAILTFLPQISLFKITLYADFFNGIMLPVIFFFLYKFANNVELMGEYKNSHLQNILLVGSGIIISLAALAGGIGEFLHL